LRTLSRARESHRARCFTAAFFAIEAFLALLELIVEQRERFSWAQDFTQPDVAPIFAPVELAFISAGFS